MSLTSVEFFRVTTADENTEDTRQDVNVAYGVITNVGNANALPLFNTVRVTFGSAAGRPEQKYLRGVIQESNVEGPLISTELRDLVQTSYANVLLGIAGYIGPTGEAHTSASVQRAIQMRQLRWSRRFRPGFRRGYVPV